MIDNTSQYITSIEDFKFIFKRSDEYWNGVGVLREYCVLVGLMYPNNYDPVVESDISRYKKKCASKRRIISMSEVIFVKFLI